jgi:hypothetical protein
MKMRKKNVPILPIVAVLFFVITFPCHAETVLDRAMKVEDQELGACIQFALKNWHERYSSGKDASLELIQKVTELYIEIKLHDTQIEHLATQLGQRNGQTSLRHELILAQAELESKRERAFAQLRTTMFIVPSYKLSEI